MGAYRVRYKIGQSHLGRHGIIDADDAAIVHHADDEAPKKNGWDIPPQYIVGDYEFFRSASGLVDNFCGCDMIEIGRASCRERV